jgi:hypothetical protein
VYCSPSTGLAHYQEKEEKEEEELVYSSNLFLQHWREKDQNDQRSTDLDYLTWRNY